MLVVRPDGSFRTSDGMPGTPDGSGVLVNQNGLAYQVIEFDDQTFVYTVAGDGTTRTAGQAPGDNVRRAQHFATDGTIYMVSRDGAITYLTVGSPSGEMHTVSAPRPADSNSPGERFVVGPDGTAYLVDH